jgi:hypothetical protein
VTDVPVEACGATFYTSDLANKCNIERFHASGHRRMERPTVPCEPRPTDGAHWHRPGAFASLIAPQPILTWQVPIYAYLPQDRCPGLMLDVHPRCRRRARSLHLYMYTAKDRKERSQYDACLLRMNFGPTNTLIWVANRRHHDSPSQR